MRETPPFTPTKVHMAVRFMLQGRAVPPAGWWIFNPWSGWWSR